MKVNVGNSKVMVCGLNERRKRLDLCLSGEILKVVDSFKYLDYIVNKVGGVFDVIGGVNEGVFRYEC